MSKSARDKPTQVLLSEWIGQLTSLLEKEKAKLQIPESQIVDDASVAALDNVGNGAQLGDADGGKKVIPQRYQFFASKSSLHSQTPESPSKSSIIGICPSGTDVQYHNESGQYRAKGGWYQSYPQPGAATPNAAITAFDSANIMGDPNGAAACLYALYADPPFFNALGDLILKNKIYQKATGIGEGWIANGSSQFWPPAEPKPASSCPAVPGDCPFEVVEPDNVPVRTMLKP